MTNLTAGTEVVQRQLAAFNDHDLDAFVACYTSDCVVTGVAPAPLRGRAEVHAFYEPRLKDLSIHCTVESLLTFGERWVVAREVVWRAGNGTETLAIFDIQTGAIARASMLKA